jgi:hypothetical protein
MNMNRWTEGICGDGAAILLDGQPVPIEEVIKILNSLDWIRVEDRLPEPDQVVLIYGGKRDSRYITDALFQPNKFFTWDAESGEHLHYVPLEEAAHWMPLPEPPK